MTTNNPFSPQVDVWELLYERDSMTKEPVVECNMFPAVILLFQPPNCSAIYHVYSTSHFPSNIFINKGQTTDKSGLKRDDSPMIIIGDRNMCSIHVFRSSLNICNFLYCKHHPAKFAGYLPFHRIGSNYNVRVVGTPFQWYVLAHFDKWTCLRSTC